VSSSRRRLHPQAGAADRPTYHETISRAGAPAANGIQKLIPRSS
jgi:hypothetical protein